MAVRIRPWEPADAEALQALASDARIAATTLVPHPYPLDGAATFIAASGPARAAREAFGFAVRDGDALVGSCGIKHFDWEARTGEIGYWIGVPFWGRGLATEAVRLVTAFGFAELGLRRIDAEVLEANPASGRVLEKAGYQRVGTFANPSDRHTGATTWRYRLEAGT
ncbi:MAG: GNAT family N-acetyltransferase [Bacteroidota bacterium]